MASAENPDKPPLRTWEEAQALKDEIFRRAAVGELTGEQADEEAKRLGLGSLSCRPDPDAFDPDKEQQWTLPMAVAWIAYRTKNAVRDAWERHQAECWHWIWRRYKNGPDGEPKAGWFLEQPTRPSLAMLVLGTIFDETMKQEDRPLMSGRLAEDQLWFYLREGALPATGIDSQTDRRVDLPAREWQELKPHQTSGGRDEVRLDAGGSGYRDVLFPSRGLRHIWPVPPPPMPMPPLVRPDGDGYMPLVCAAQWIATKGGTEAFDPEVSENWLPAYDLLLAAIASDKVRVVGSRDGVREPVPGYHFAGCKVDYPSGSAPMGLTHGDDLYLRSYPYIDDEHWNGAFNDALVRRHQERWSRLMVAKEDIRAQWSFVLHEPAKTGAPGRPSSMYLVIAELQRRGLAGELQHSLTMEAEALAAWLARTHPDRPPLLPKSIRNKIGALYRAIKLPKISDFGRV